MNVNDLALFLTGVLVGAGLIRYGIGVGIKTVYSVKADAPLSKIDTATEQDDTFQEEAE